MKLKLSILFLLVSFSCFPAARFWVGGNATWDGTAGTKWATTSGGAGGAAVPTSADDVHLDNGTGTGNVTTATSATICTCKTFDCTGYVGTLTVNGNINIAGSCTIVTGMTITTSAGTPQFVFSATGTLTSNTKTWPYAVSFTGASAIYTLADNWTVTGTVSTSGTNTYTSNTLNVGGGLSMAGNASGTMAIVLNGTGTWSGAAGCSLTLTINTSGTITVSGTVFFGAKTLTYTAGTVTVTSSTLSILSGCTLNTSGMTWNNVTISGSGFITTLSSDLNLSGNFTTVTGGMTVNGAFNINIGGNLTLGNSLAGTASVVLNGTGTWSGAFNITNNLSINTAGTITISGTVDWGTGTFTYTAGTMAGVSTPNININTGTPTVTLNALFTYPGTITATVTTIFNGANGFTISDFSCITAGKTITFQASNSYTMTHGCIITGTAASAISLVSSSGSVTAFFNVNNGAPSLDLGYVTATYIDSSAGRTMWNYKGIDNNTVNWALLGNPVTIGMPFCR